METQLEYVMQQLEVLGTERTKKNYLSRGAKEPLYGVASGAMKPLSKEIGQNQALANLLFQTGNYDAMYFAGMIADPTSMKKKDFEAWMDCAYTELISNNIVSVTLAESPAAQDIAGAWIDDERVLYQTAGWSCYEWLVGFLPDEKLDTKKLASLLVRTSQAIRTKPDTVKLAMAGFVGATGVSILALYDEAKRVASEIEGVTYEKKGEHFTLPSALKAIETAEAKNRLGFKRKSVRC